MGALQGVGQYCEAQFGILMARYLTILVNQMYLLMLLLKIRLTSHFGVLSTNGTVIGADEKVPEVKFLQYSEC